MSMGVMGTYYQISNYSKKEIISLASVANIKQEVFERQGYQTAILNIFLGFGWPGCSLGLGDWIGRWSRDAIAIENDGDDNESDGWVDAPDVGMEFLVWFRKSEEIWARWLRLTGLPWHNLQDEWLREYGKESR